MIHEEVQELLSFVDKNPTAFHTTASIREILLKEGFTELLESRKWDLTPGEGYFVCRNGSSVIAFRLGTDLKDYSFNVAAAHTDSPCFKIKENAELHMGQKYTRLNTEGYGGMICSTWLDRPLSIAGRVLVQEGQAVTSRLVALDRDLLLIPSVAIHMNREVNDKASYNKQVDMLPLLGSDLKDGALLDIVAQELGVKRDPGQRLVPVYPGKGHRVGGPGGIPVLRPSGRPGVRLRHPEGISEGQKRTVRQRGGLLRQRGGRLRHQAGSGFYLPV